DYFWHSTYTSGKDFLF
nr:immunoglobulin light chain junction region [Macaca mulatta]MOX70923.1 immunoglobulin light chain junction region [Macaca mulatta]MOX71022.1 immunoglobulin light chain junction region [Macaca mulatta]MOX72701.1 immunoglobulin light chain junction region [Macaca mulatta]MOX77170.1 immunoglobulin light chain junction region [Macaca mulatta]